MTETVTRPAGTTAATVPFPGSLPAFDVRKGRYRAWFASGPEEVEAALRLRYQVFNVELGEGLAESEATGLDRDRFDAQCHHLLVAREETGEVVGTYRLQTEDMAASGHGFYTAQEFVLSLWPADIAPRAVEIGRAAIARDHRQGVVLLLLWQGLGAYAIHNRKRYLFGCCSLTSQDPAEAARALEWLRQHGHLHPRLQVVPTPEYDCAEQRESVRGWQDTHIPILFRTYLRYGSRICGRPALDREFKTIDYLALLDLKELDPATILRRFAVDIRESP
jgi:putative hemolysin